MKRGRNVLVVPADDFEFISRLWQDWSPGYDGAQDVAREWEEGGGDAALLAEVFAGAQEDRLGEFVRDALALAPSAVVIVRDDAAPPPATQRR